MDVVWQPQAGPQKSLIDCPVYEILFGGARGGGKTDGIIGKYGLKQQAYGPAFNGVIFRREMPQADDLWERAREIYTPLGAKFNETSKSIRFKSGGRLRLRPLERVSDAEKYQGQNLTDAAIEEAGNYPDPNPILRLHACLRSAAGVPVQMLLSANPGGPGQQWIKRRYIDPAPQGMQVLRETIDLRDPKGPRQVTRSRVFIPAKVWDNRILLARDPMYVANLHLVGSEALVRAWLDGDWSVVEGAYFDCWRTDKHVIQPCELPDYWRRFRSMDWGSARPFSVGWWAIASEDFEHPDGFMIPRGALVRYREWYGCREPNVGLKMTAEEVARGIVARETKDESFAYSVVDPSMFARDGGPSIAGRIAQTGKMHLRKADNRRVARRGAMGGWDQLRARMVGEDGRPMIYCFSTCTDSIRTIPALQHDEARPEDVDTDSEDHAADEWRYACMSRPYAAPTPEKAGEIKTSPPTLNELIALQPKADSDGRRERI